MLKASLFAMAFSAFFQFALSVVLPTSSLAQDWSVRTKPRGTIRVVDFLEPHVSAMLSYSEGLVALDKDNNWVPCLAVDWRWINDRTIEFELRTGVKFHNGEAFNAEAVRINWEAYKKMENPRPISITNLPDETILEIVDDYRIRFVLPEPDGMALIKFMRFLLIAPEFFAEHKVDELNWVYLSAGPWGTGPFKFIEGSVRYAKPSPKLVLVANDNYWDRRYPKLEKVIFDNALIGDKTKAMELCRESEGQVDLVSFLRPLDTLKVAESRFAKVVKSKDNICLLGIFNQRKRDSKWRDIRLRKAVNYAVNREELWRYCAKGNAWNLGGHIAPGAYGYNPELPLFKYNAETAKTLLADAGYSEGCTVKILSIEAWALEGLIISKMLERVGFKTELEVLPLPKAYKKIYIPYLDKPPEEQDWDILLFHQWDIYGNTGSIFMALFFIEKVDLRWIEYDSTYENMWADMAKTVNRTAQENKIRNLGRYLYDNAYALFLYSPVMLYAVNKEVNFVPQENIFLRLKETSVTDNHWSIRGNNN